MAKINFLEGTASAVTTNADYRKAHGILMILAWAVCAVLAAAVARYLTMLPVLCLLCAC